MSRQDDIQKEEELTPLSFSFPRSYVIVGVGMAVLVVGARCVSSVWDSLFSTTGSGDSKSNERLAYGNDEPVLMEDPKYGMAVRMVVGLTTKRARPAERLIATPWPPPKTPYPPFLTDGLVKELQER